MSSVSTAAVSSPQISVNSRVSYYQVGNGRFGVGGGWRFGFVIGLHCDNVGVDSTGLQMATIRFPELNREFPAGDYSLPLFLLVAEQGAE